MRLGETIATYDVGLALRGKSGKFEVTSPAGEIYDVTCKPNHATSNLEWSSNEVDRSPFLIRRVAERATQSETTASAGMLEEEHHSVPSPLPFVLEHALDERDSSNFGNIELVYIEENPETGQPSACLYLKNERRDHSVEAEKWMTSQCANFNELDCEIRRLEAQLDEIRSRAKKMFYKTQAVAASA